MKEMVKQLKNTTDNTINRQSYGEEWISGMENKIKMIIQIHINKEKVTKEREWYFQKVWRLKRTV